jgi:OFA family oxalate/formate antiporter-like MFS transporter
MVKNGDNESRFFYGWIVVIASFLITFICYSIRYTFGIFSVSLSKEFKGFGWTDTLIFGAFLFSTIVGGLSGIVMGRLIDRYGPKITVGFSGFLVGLGMVLCSQINAIWQFYIFNLLLGVGMGICFAPPMAITSKWFIKRRGLALGIVALGIGIGTIFMPPVITYLISAYGWRSAYLIVGFIAWIILISAAFMLKPSPVKNDASSYHKNGKSGNLNEDWDVLESAKTRSFWLVLLSYAFWNLCLQMIMVQIVPYAEQGIGTSPMVAAGVLSLIGASSIFGRIAIGFASDRIGTKRVWLFCLVCQAVAMFWLTETKNVWMLYVFSSLFGFAYGGIVPLIPAIDAEFFGTRNLGAIMGLVGLGSTISGALGPFLGAYIFDLTGSYYLAFLLGAVATVLAAILAIPAKKPERG